MELGSRRFLGGGVITKIFSKIQTNVTTTLAYYLVYNKDENTARKSCEIENVVETHNLQAVCDTPIARFTGYVLMKGMSRQLPLVLASTRVHRVIQRHCNRSITHSLANVTTDKILDHSALRNRKDIFKDKRQDHLSVLSSKEKKTA